MPFVSKSFYVHTPRYFALAVSLICYDKCVLDMRARYLNTLNTQLMIRSICDVLSVQVEHFCCMIDYTLNKIVALVE